MTDCWAVSDEDFDYEANDAEAVVYLISQSGQPRNACLYVMKRSEAVEFCSHQGTAVKSGAMAWAYCFTTHRRYWREELDTFRRDDGRFDWLLEELGIEPIYRGGEPAPEPIYIPRPLPGRSWRGTLFEGIL